MSYLDMVEQFISENIEVRQPKPIMPTIEQVTNMKLSELAKRNIAIQIFSKVLDCNIWLCSNIEMANQVTSDDPEAITYSVDEVRELIRLRPSPHELRKINDIKAVFRG